MAFLYSPPSSGSSTYTISSKTANYTVISTDLGTVINCSGASSFTIALTAAATLGAGFNCVIWNTSTTTAMTVTIDPNGSETIDGFSILYLNQGEGTQIVCDGTNWQTGAKKTMRGYAENFVASNSRPAATGLSSAAIGEAANASSTYSLALGSSAAASGLRTIAIGVNTVASANYTTAIGLNSAAGASQAVTGAGAMALGGSYASGADSFAAAIADNTSSYGAKIASGVAIGYHAIASNQAGNIAIGYQPTSSGTRSIALGYTPTASGAGSVAIGGYAYGATAAATYGIAIGDGCNVVVGATAGVAIGWNNSLSSTANGSIALGNENQTNPICGKITYGPTNTPGSGVPAGRPRWGNQVVFADTTDATPTVLTTAASSGSSTATHNTIIGIENNTAFMFSAMIVARQSATNGTASAAWKIEGLIRREGTAASTTLVNYITTVISNVPGWTIAVSADTTNGGLAITATGAAATNIRWVATAQTSEVTYA